MGMATLNQPERTPRCKGLTLCQNCGAEYTNNGNWVMAYNINMGTEAPQYRKIRDIPAGVCPICETPP